MKNLVLIACILFGSVAAMAQNPNAPARIGNRTACPMYVKLMVTDMACNLSLTATYVVPPYTVIGVPAPGPGTWYDGALVDDTPTFSGACYYQKVSVPWALCTPYPSSVINSSCCGPMIKSDWNLGGSPANPFFIIYQ